MANGITGKRPPLELLEVKPPTREQIVQPRAWPTFRLIMSRPLSYHEQLVLEEFFQGAYVVSGGLESIVHWRVRAQELSANVKRLAKLVRALEQRGDEIEKQQQADLNVYQRVADMATEMVKRVRS